MMEERREIFREFGDCLLAGEDPRTVDIGVLRQVVEIYPWFTTARMMLSRAEGEIDPLLELPLLCRPAPAFFQERIGADEFTRRSTEEIIDSFLESGEYRIVPKDDTPQAEAEEDETPEEDEFMSEELAEIYMAQGLTEQAGRIYRKLSLLYPEKSVYFAEIIGKLDGKDLNKEE